MAKKYKISQEDANKLLKLVEKQQEEIVALKQNKAEEVKEVEEETATEFNYEDYIKALEENKVLREENEKQTSQLEKLTEPSDKEEDDIISQMKQIITGDK